MYKYIYICMYTTWIPEFWTQVSCIGETHVPDVPRHVLIGGVWQRDVVDMV